MAARRDEIVSLRVRILQDEPIVVAADDRHARSSQAPHQAVARAASRVREKHASSHEQSPPYGGAMGRGRRADTRTRHYTETSSLWKPRLSAGSSLLPCIDLCALPPITHQGMTAHYLVAQVVEICQEL